jgi:hypothetical protein
VSNLDPIGARPPMPAVIELDILEQVAFDVADAIARLPISSTWRDPLFRALAVVDARRGRLTPPAHPAEQPDEYVALHALGNALQEDLWALEREVPDSHWIAPLQQCVDVCIDGQRRLDADHGQAAA